MYISHNPYINQSTYKPQTFKANTHKANTPVAKSNNGLKRVFPWIFGFLGICCGSGNYSSVANQTYSGVEDSLGIRTEYFDVLKETKDSLMKPVYELKAKLNKSNDFINGMRIDVAHSFKEMTPNNAWRRYVIENESEKDFMGTSFYSDKKLKKHVSIQEIAHDDYKMAGKNGKETILPAMRHTMMHELGHHFDTYFGHDHKAKLATQWDSILYAKLKNPFESPYDFELEGKEEIIDSMNMQNKDLSDKIEYRRAFLKDFNNLKNIPEDKLPLDIDYYIGNFDIKKVMKASDLDKADEIRGEVYANLFAYVLGQNDGDKNNFVRSFKNCNEIVKKDVAKYLKLVK